MQRGDFAYSRWFTVSAQLFKSTQAVTAIMELIILRVTDVSSVSDATYHSTPGDFDEFRLKQVRLHLTIFLFLVYLVVCLLHSHCRSALHFSPCLSHTPEEPHINESLYRCPVCCWPAKVSYILQSSQERQPAKSNCGRNKWLKKGMKGSISSGHAVSKGRNVSIVNGGHLGWFM